MRVVSADPATNRREALNRARAVEAQLAIQARMAQIESKVDRALALGREAAKEPSTPAKPPEDPAVVALAKAMGDKDYHLPTGAIPSLTFNEDDEIVCTGLTIEGRFWSVSNIVALGLINERGAWLWSRYSAITYALPPAPGTLLRPHHAATVAGRPSL